MRLANGLEYEVTGASEGEQVLFIHGSQVAGAFLPLTQQPVLAETYSLIRYHRRGFAGSDRHTGPFSIADQAHDAAVLMEAAESERAHVVGHSYGGIIALQLALDAPELVHSVTLIEPAIYAQLRPELAGPLSAAIARHVERYRGGDAMGAVDAFMRGAEGPDWQSQTVPGGAEQAFRDAATFFEVENDAMNAWTFHAHAAARIMQPVLYLVGGGGQEGRRERMEGFRDVFSSLVSQTESATIPEATHSLHIHQAEQVASVMSEFFRRHPMERHGE